MIKLITIALFGALIIFCSLIPIKESFELDENVSMNSKKVETLDLSSFSQDRPSRRLRFLFIHHSCGGQLLAEPGPVKGEHGIYETHPNGGGLRLLLEKTGYEVHEASYSSEIGHQTDIFDWWPKFMNQMEKVLSCSHQNDYYPGEEKNHIVAFKSCFPNNFFIGEGQAPGNPNGPGLTLWNAKAAYKALLEEFKKFPQVLFICVTTPPVAPKVKQPLWKWLAKKILGKQKNLNKAGGLAREFSNWLKDKKGWLEDYGGTNVVVFDHYDILTGEGKSNLSVYPTGDGDDSHPNRQGNEKAAKAFIPFVNRAIRRAGLCE